MRQADRVESPRRGEPPRWRGKRSTIPLLVVGSIVAVGALVRAQLLDQVIRRDEAQTYLQFAGSFTAALTDYSQPNNHILHSILVRVSTLLAGGEPWAIRLPAYLAGVALIGVVYWWVSSTAGRRAGYVAAALVAGSSVLIEYSTIARGYTMIAVAFVALLEISRRLLIRDTPRLWTAWVLVALLGFVTVPVFALPFAGVAGWFTFNVVADLGFTPRRTLLLRGGGAVAVVGALTAVAYLPAVAANGFDAIVANDFVRGLSWGDLPQLWKAGLVDLEKWLLRDWYVVLAYPVLATVAALHGPAKADRLFSPALVLVGPALLVVVQRLAPLERIWLFLWPLTLGLVGIGARSVLDRIPRLGSKGWLVGAAAAILAVVMGWRVLSTDQVILSREAGIFRDGPEVADWLVPRLETDDRVVVESHPRWVLAYYLNRHPVGTANLARDYANAERLFVVVYRPRSQELPSVLAEAHVRTDEFTAPDRVARMDETEIFLAERQN